jgi:endonuclease YncB( thermonuclease family)
VHGGRTEAGGKMKFLLLLLLLPSLCLGASFKAKVVAVHDGDTITVLKGKKQKRVVVRLMGIDAPELQQVYGTDAAAVLSKLCLGQMASVVSQKLDTYGRTIASVKCNKVDAAKQMVGSGAAWVYDQYVPKQSPLRALQQKAQAARVGLWAQPLPEAPWQWRKEHLKVKE